MKYLALLMLMYGSLFSQDGVYKFCEEKLPDDWCLIFGETEYFHEVNKDSVFVDVGTYEELYRDLDCNDSSSVKDIQSYDSPYVDALEFEKKFSVFYTKKQRVNFKANIFKQDDKNFPERLTLDDISDDFTELKDSLSVLEENFGSFCFKFHRKSGNNFYFELKFDCFINMGKFSYLFLNKIYHVDLENYGVRFMSVKGDFISIDVTANSIILDGGNPLVIKNSILINNDMKSIKIYDTSGRMIISASKSHKQIDLNSLHQGIYFLEVDNTITKFIKE